MINLRPADAHPDWHSGHPFGCDANAPFGWRLRLWEMEWGFGVAVADWKWVWGAGWPRSGPRIPGHCKGAVGVRSYGLRNILSPQKSAVGAKQDNMQPRQQSYSAIVAA